MGWVSLGREALIWKFDLTFGFDILKPPWTPPLLPLVRDPRPATPLVINFISESDIGRLLSDYELLQSSLSAILSYNELTMRLTGPTTKCLYMLLITLYVCTHAGPPINQTIDDQFGNSLPGCVPSVAAKWIESNRSRLSPDVDQPIRSLILSSDIL